ncbi:deubiquitination-protection protein dph1 [Blumeria hordei DH14]|uniref:Deubiquitination-protection protein dph1 n=1 Tax=Blumeria graminis f. sp. hordei (strain DH14) TaxID=546991 RepID=N1JDL0_BLUG1|nr:deubiquitination-protection protein dph1 [Blumeria hordei DH14]
MSGETAPNEGETQLTFKVKTSGEKSHTITVADSTTILDLKTKLSGTDYESISADRMRLIYSGRVMKDTEPLSTYKIKNGNTIHMVKSAASNVSSRPANSGSSATGPESTGVPANMAAGTANNPLAGLTGARYAGHVQLPNADIFGADGGMGVPPSEDQVAGLLEDPNFFQTMNELLNNPSMVDMLLGSIPGLRDNPEARAMFQSPEFRRMITNPETIRQAAAMRRLVGGNAAAANAFPAPGITDNMPSNMPPRNITPGANPVPQTNPFAALLGGQTLPRQGSPQVPNVPTSTEQGLSPAGDSNPQNPFASLFGNNQSSVPMLPMTPEMVQHAIAMLQAGGMNSMFAGNTPGVNPLASLAAGQEASISDNMSPADTRPPEEIYANQLRQLNDMGFFDFDRNVAALRRSGGNVQGAIEQLLG